MDIIFQWNIVSDFFLKELPERYQIAWILPLFGLGIHPAAVPAEC
jgi:hypothetical protein